jgi:hypothetical protein
MKGPDGSFCPVSCIVILLLGILRQRLQGTIAFSFSVKLHADVMERRTTWQQSGAVPLSR